MTRARDLSNLIGSGNYTSTTFTATAGQTVFTIAHTQGFIQVFMNGLLLDETTDYTSNGTAVTLTEAATAGDELEVVKYNTFSVGDAITQTDADTRYVNASGDTMTGNLTIEGATLGSTFANAAYGNGVRVEQTSYTADNYVSLIEAPYIANYSSAGAHVRIGAKFNGGGSSLAMGTSNAYGSGITNTALEIDSAGRVTMPYQPAFFCRPPTGFTINGEVAISGTWDLSGGGYNTGNHFNLSNGTFTAPISGKYLINWSALVSTNNSRLDFYLTVNDAQRIREEVNGYSTTQTNRSGSVHGILNLSANDVVKFHIANFGGSPREIYSGARIPWSYASGYLLG
nr:hypothetical protein 6 [bacterium]